MFLDSYIHLKMYAINSRSPTFDLKGTLKEFGLDPMAVEDAPRTNKKRTRIARSGH